MLRVSVNVRQQPRRRGFDTNLAPSMTIGTGFAGRSSLGENLEPQHLVNWTRIAYNADTSSGCPSSALTPRHASDPGGRVPAGVQRRRGSPLVPSPTRTLRPAGRDDLREEIRRVVVEELRHFVNRT